MTQVNSLSASRSITSSGNGNSQSNSGIDGQIAQLQKRKADLQSKINAKEAYAQQCYDAVAGPTQLGNAFGIDEAKKKTGETMAKWAMGPGAEIGGQNVDQMKAEIANIDEQIQGLEQQKEIEQKKDNGNDKSNNQEKVNELENKVSNLRTEESQALKQNNLPKAQKIDLQISDLENQIASMRGQNKAAVAA